MQLQDWSQTHTHINMISESKDKIPLDWILNFLFLVTFVYDGSLFDFRILQNKNDKILILMDQLKLNWVALFFFVKVSAK